MTGISSYHEKINAVLNHIDKQLGETIQINDLAKVSHFSPFHFQRIFKSIVGETPYEFILRLRLERSVRYLKFRANQSIAEIAYACGFPSPENFSRQFKSRFGFSPSQFRRDKKLHNSRIYQEPNQEDFYLVYEKSRAALSEMNFEVSLESLPELKIAYIRAVFGEDGSGLVEKYLELMKWVEEEGIAYKGPLKRFGMSIDDVSVTPVGKYRYDFAVRMDRAEPPTSDLIEVGVIPQGTYATLTVDGDLAAVARAWDYLYTVWLPDSGYAPRDFPAIEEFLQGPEEIGWDRFVMNCRVPIEKIN